MLLAAGYGTRLRPVTETIPKPLVSIYGKPILDYALDHFESYGIERVIVNGHYLSEMLQDHLASYQGPMEIIFSHEPEILGGVGGVKKVLHDIGDDPFLLVNGDVIWIDRHITALDSLLQSWSPEKELVVLVHARERAVGYDREGDFVLGSDGLLSRKEKPMPYVCTGLQIISPRLFHLAPSNYHSLADMYFERIANQKLYGVAFEGEWIEIGTVQAIKDAECAMEKGFHPVR